VRCNSNQRSALSKYRTKNQRLASGSLSLRVTVVAIAPKREGPVTWERRPRPRARVCDGTSRSVRPAGVPYEHCMGARFPSARITGRAPGTTKLSPFEEKTRPRGASEVSRGGRISSAVGQIAGLSTHTPASHDASAVHSGSRAQCTPSGLDGAHPLTPASTAQYVPPTHSPPSHGSGCAGTTGGMHGSLHAESATTQNPSTSVRAIRIGTSPRRTEARARPRTRRPPHARVKPSPDTRRPGPLSRARPVCRRGGSA